MQKGKKMYPALVSQVFILGSDFSQTIQQLRGDFDGTLKKWTKMDVFIKVV